MEKILQSIETFTSRKIFTIRVNLGIILAVAFFWMYGVFGFFTPHTLSFPIQIAISLVFLASFLYIITLRNLEKYRQEIAITGKDILVLSSYFAVLGLFSFRELATSIDGDQLYHAQQAMLPALTGVSLLVHYTGTFLDTIPLMYVMWFINIVLMCALVYAYIFFKKIKATYVIAIGGLLFLALRFAVFFTSGNGSAFPPLRLLPLWVTGTVFSPSSFTFRLATFIGLIFLMWFIQRRVTIKLSPLNAYLFALCVGTIPVLLHVGTLVEMSLWATCALVFFLFSIDDWCEGKKVDYVVLISLIVLFSCMRVSPFVTLIPIGLLFYIDWFREKYSLQEVVRTFSPILLLVPVVFASVYIGTPASYHGFVSFDPYIEAHASLLTRLQTALSSGAFYTHIYNTFRFPLIALIFIFPLLLLSNVKRFFVVSFTFILYFILFYSIAPGLWGNGRYQAEYVVPAIIYALYLLCVHFKARPKLITLLISILIGSNIVLFTHASNLNKQSHGQDVYFSAMKKRGEYFIWSQLPYNFKDALQTARQDGFAGKLYYSPGNGYGYFAEVLSGYTVNEMKSERDSISRIGDGISTSTAETIIADKEIHLVLINGSIYNKETLNEHMVTALQKKGWVPWKTFTNSIYQTTIYGFVPPN